MQRMGEGLALSQDAAARDARSLAERLSKAAAGSAPGSESARGELKSAAESMEAAAAAAQSEQSDSAAQSARQGLEALGRASSALSGAKQSAESGQPAAGSESSGSQQPGSVQSGSQQSGSQQSGSQQSGSQQSGSQQSAAQQAQEQAQLSERAGELDKGTDGASLSEAAQNSTSSALQKAQDAMQRASESLQEGERSEAADAQREALDALAEAEREASRGVAPQSEEGQAKAEELAREQERIREQLLALARRLEESQAATPPPGLSRAQESAQEAQSSLQQGNLDGAQEQEEETEREIREAMRDLEEEERQYEELRQEELLFKITEEVAGMLESHRVQMDATREIDSGRRADGRESASRADRLRLRNVSREEEAIAQRSGTVVEAILEEGARVFAEVLSNVQADLTEVARRCGEAGGYRSDEGVQALQAEVEDSLLLLLDSLQNELERRQQEQTRPGTPPPDGTPPLVPDVAELKVLRKIEEGILQRMDELLVLHPELESEQVDSILLRDLGRLAYRHQRMTELFQDLRRRLGLSDPPPLSEDSEHP
jgi:hypothetical protein